jgi:predicted nucleotidyltransferase
MSNTKKQIQLSEKYLTIIRKILSDTMAEKSCTAYLFGSRANGRAKPSSDIDIAIQASSPIEKCVSHIKDCLEDSFIPYSFDIINMADADDKFKNKAITEGILIWKN